MHPPLEGEQNPFIEAEEAVVLDVEGRCLRRVAQRANSRDKAIIKRVVGPLHDSPFQGSQAVILIILKVPDKLLVLDGL